jgi:class 3 adenylate cyclase
MPLLELTAVMKTDISGSTPRFRALLTEDLQSLLEQHRALVERCAAERGGTILKAAGDGYWLKFRSVTAAAQAAMDMQEALRLAQPNRGDDRLSMRIVIALGDIAMHEGDMVGDTLALAARVEAVTPPDETISRMPPASPWRQPRFGLPWSIAFRSRDMPSLSPSTASSSGTGRKSWPTRISWFPICAASVPSWKPER